MLITIWYYGLLFALEGVIYTYLCDAMRFRVSTLKVILSLLILSGAAGLTAQQTPRLITTEARFENVLVLRMTPERYVEFGIQKINENLYQITKHPEDVMFSVESTGNWDLTISANDAYFTGEIDSTHKVPVDFIGLTIENIGTNWDNGLFSNIANATKDTVIYLSPERTPLLESGLRGNIGGSNENAFILRWKFFYENATLRTMKFSSFDILDDLYKVGYTITLSESSNRTYNDQ